MEGGIEINTCRPNRLQDSLKPLLWSMKLFGVYHDVPDVISVSPSTQMVWQSNPKHNRRCPSILRFYCAIILIIVWLNLIRYGVGLLPSDRFISLRIALLVWFGLVAVGDLIMFIICEKKTHLRSFYKQWNELYQDTERFTAEKRGDGLSRVVIIGTVAGWLVIIINVTTIMYVDICTNMAETIVRPFPISTLSNVLFLIVMFLATGIYIFPVIFMIVISYEVMSSFDRMSAVIEKHVIDAGNGVPLALDKLRRFHLQLCRGVSLLDRSFRLLVLTEYVTNIPLACFLVYLTVNVLDELFMTMSNLMFISSNVFVIAAVTLSCALVHEADNPLNLSVKRCLRSAAFGNYNENGQQYKSKEEK